MKSIKLDEFFKLVAVNAGASDIQNVKDIYYGMIRTMSRELKKNQMVELPDWGKFVLKTYKARKIKDVNLGISRELPPTLMVKFVPDYKVKKYFSNFGDGSTVI